VAEHAADLFGAKVTECRGVDARAFLRELTGETIEQ